MVVVKADGYGHGMFECAREARVAGADWLGVATPAEALMLREAGDVGPGAGLAVRRGGGSRSAGRRRCRRRRPTRSSRLAGSTAAAATSERRARVHLKIDTGLSRNGAPSYDWQQLCAAAAEAEHAGALEVVGIWSHLAAADEPGHPSVALQLEAFQRGYEQAQGCRPRADLATPGELGRSARGAGGPPGSGPCRHRRVRHRPGAGDRSARRCRRCGR